MPEKAFSFLLSSLLKQNKTKQNKNKKKTKQQQQQQNILA